MRVTVRGGDSAPDLLDLAISVDRGAASYTYFGNPGHNDIWQRGVFAHTSPV